MKEKVKKILKNNSYNTSKDINKFYNEIGVKLDVTIGTSTLYSDKVYFNGEYKDKLNNNYTLIELTSYHKFLLSNNEIKTNSSNFCEIYKNLLSLRKEIKKEDKQIYQKLKFIVNNTISSLLLNKLDIKIENPNIFQEKIEHFINDIKQITNVIYINSNEFILDNYEKFKLEINEKLKDFYVDYSIKTTQLKEYIKENNEILYDEITIKQTIINLIKKNIEINNLSEFVNFVYSYLRKDYNYTHEELLSIIHELYETENKVDNIDISNFDETCLLEI